MKNRSTAAILAFFLSGLGIHRFYLGQGGLGVFYFIFCWTLIPAFIAFIDCLIFIFMSDAVFNSKYNSGGFIGNVNTAAELEKLYELKEKGIITEQEFNVRKAKLL